jgi:hypothetical protein
MYNSSQKLAFWIIEQVAQRKDYYTKDGELCWDWIAADIWDNYPGHFNEFVINEAIEFIWEAAES